MGHVLCEPVLPVAACARFTVVAQSSDTPKGAPLVKPFVCQFRKLAKSKETFIVMVL